MPGARREKRPPAHFRLEQRVRHVKKPAKFEAAYHALARIGSGPITEEAAAEIKRALDSPTSLLVAEVAKTDEEGSGADTATISYTFTSGTGLPPGSTTTPYCSPPGQARSESLRIQIILSKVNASGQMAPTLSQLSPMRRSMHRTCAQPGTPGWRDGERAPKGDCCPHGRHLC